MSLAWENDTIRAKSLLGVYEPREISWIFWDVDGEVILPRIMPVKLEAAAEERIFGHCAGNSSSKIPDESIASCLICDRQAHGNAHISSGSHHVVRDGQLLCRKGLRVHRDVVVTRDSLRSVCTHLFMLTLSRWTMPTTRGSCIATHVAGTSLIRDDNKCR